MTLMFAIEYFTYIMRKEGRVLHGITNTNESVQVPYCAMCMTLMFARVLYVHYEKGREGITWH